MALDERDSIVAIVTYSSTPNIHFRYKDLNLLKKGRINNMALNLDKALFSKKEQREESVKFDSYLGIEPLTKRELYDKLLSSDEYTTKITSDVLLRSPYHFFRKYEKDVKEIVELVQNQLSEEGKSQVISQLHEDPTNKKLQNRAREEIRAKLTQFNSSTKGAGILNKYDEHKAERGIINALVIDEITGIGPLQPLWEDSKITEIICNGPYNIEVEFGGKLHKVPGCSFRDPNHLLALINRLYGSINKSVSANVPHELGRLHDNSRMHAVHPVIAPEGPNFNIRRHSDSFITPQELLGYKSISTEAMTFLGNMIYSGATCLIVGGTGSGKTTLLNALTGFIRENERCVSLEKNLEMKPHPNKWFAAPMETIKPKAGVKNSVEVTMRDLVNMSMQMRPETLIIGEVTDDSAYDLTQACNTGHRGLATIHADSAEDAPSRMMALVSQSGLVKEDSAYALIATAFDFIVFTKRFELDGSRKIVTIAEVGNKVRRDEENNNYLPITNIWEFEPDPQMTEATGMVAGNWVKTNEISDHMRSKLFLDIKKGLTWEQLDVLSAVTK